MCNAIERFKKFYKNKVTPSIEILLFSNYRHTEYASVCVVEAYFYFLYKFNIFTIFSMNIIIDYLILTSFRVIENYVLFKFCKAAAISSHYSTIVRIYK